MAASRTRVGALTGAGTPYRALATDRGGKRARWAGVLFVTSLCLGLPAHAQNSATLVNITSSSTTTQTELGLGYPVPVPSSTPEPQAARYRSWSAVTSRLMALSTTLDPHEVVVLHNLGSSSEGRAIYALRISDADGVRDDGSPEPKVVFTGGIHAREWISPEVVLRIAEHFITGFDPANDDYLEFLVRNTEVWVAPVLNPDGFVYTQANHDVMVDFDIPGFPCSLCLFSRDGRMRRKNLRNHEDETFTPIDKEISITEGGLGTVYEGLVGVDLNRNNRVGYANDDGNPPNESDPRYTSYRGEAGADEASYDLAQAEPETRALDKLIHQLAGPAGIRGFIDYHSFSSLFVLVETADPARNTLVQQLLTRIQSVVNDALPSRPDYTIELVGDDEDTGATDSLVASLAQQPPAFTFEMPPAGGGVEGFVTRESELTPIVDENLPGAKMLVDFANGPAYLRKLVVWQDDDADGSLDWPDEARHVAEWEATSGAASTQRTLSLPVEGSVGAGELRVMLSFSDPMKLPDGMGDPVEADGSTPAIDPTVSFDWQSATHPVTAAGGWLETKQSGTSSITPGYSEYQFDTWEGTATLPATAAAAYTSSRAVLTVAAKDLMDNELDGLPSTVADLAGQWVQYEDGLTPAQVNAGGSDVQHVFHVDPVPPVIDAQVSKDPIF